MESEPIKKKPRPKSDGTVNFILTEEALKEIEFLSGGFNKMDKFIETFSNNNGFYKKIIDEDSDTFENKMADLLNKKMVKYAKKDQGVLFAFWNGKADGVDAIIKYAKKMGLSVFIDRPWHKKIIMIWLLLHGVGGVIG